MNGHFGRHEGRIATEQAVQRRRYGRKTAGAVPAGALIEAMVNDYATHKCPKAKRWLARHPRWTFYLIVDLQTATDRYRLRKPGVEFASAGQSAPSTQMSRAQIRSDGVQSDHVAIRAHIGPGAKSSPFIHQLAPLVEQVTARI